MPSKKSKYLVGITALVVFGISLVPTVQHNVLTHGTDSYEAHTPLVGKKVASQTTHLQGDLLGVGAILVDMRRSDNPADVQVTVQDEEGQQLATATIVGSTLTDDAFSNTQLPQAIPKQTSPLTVTFSAPLATTDNPVGIRTDLDQNRMLAIQTTQQVPLWKAINTAIRSNVKAAYTISIAIAIAIALTLATTQKRRSVAIALIAALVVIQITAHLAWLPQLHGVSGGDPYNYLSITKKLTNLENPFAGVKRLPGYPALLVPAFISQSINDQVYMRAVMIISAAASLVLLALLARSLGLPWPIQFIAPALLAFQKDFFWISLRPEPYTLYTALLLASLVLFFHLEKRWAQILFGLTLGYAAMVRQEGFVLAIVLGVVAVLHIVLLSWHTQSRKRIMLKNYSVAFLPALLIVTPFFLHNWLSYGSPIYTPYFAGERLQIVDSWTAFQNNAGSAWGVLGSMWRPSWDQLDRVPLDQPLFAVSIIVASIWWTLTANHQFQRHRSLQTMLSLLPIALLIVTAIYAISNRAQLAEIATTIPTAAAIASAIPFLATTRWRGAMVALVLLSQLLVATWFHPFAKHYQQSYPLIVLMLATLLMAPALVSNKRWLNNWRPAPLLASLTIVILILFAGQNAFRDRANQTTALDHVTFQAIQVARTQSGPVAFDADYQQAILYYGDTGHYFRHEGIPESQEPAWLRDNQIKTLVTTSATNALNQPPDTWQEIANFKAEGKKEVIFESTVYSLTNPAF